jgi:mannose-1-phosphate guanylyltransferase/mannose-6-phosphate isomerase
MKVLILAGGSGTRLWPLSREHQPKQTLAPFGEKTLLQQTITRCLGFVKSEYVFVCAGLQEYERIKAQCHDIPRENIIVEPERKGKASAIAFALAQITTPHNQHETIAIIPSDSFVADVITYQSAITKAATLISTTHTDHLIMLGAQPTSPEIGYGYIQIGESIENQVNTYTVASFREKPDLTTALSYIASGCYVWNTGVFIATSGTFRHLLVKHLPHLAELISATEAKDWQRARTIFTQLPKAEIESEVIEKENKNIVLTVACGWTDVGSWKNASEVAENLAVQHHKVIAINSERCQIFAPTQKMVTVVGLNDLVIVDTADALFISTKEKSGEVKEVVKTLKANPSYAEYL